METPYMRSSQYVMIGALIGVTIAAVYFLGNSESGIHTLAKDASPDVYPKTINPNPQKRSYTIIAQDAEIEVANGVKAKVWTYNGTVPGPTLRF